VCGLSLSARSLFLVAPPALASGFVIDDARMTQREIVDHHERNMVALAFVTREQWQDTSQVFSNYGNINALVTITVAAETPSNAEAFFLFRPVQFWSFRPDGGFWKAASVWPL
jgi:hypothetical protein